MFRAQSLALYKNRPVLVLEVRDRIDIRLEDGSSLRVRDKDLAPLHEGPVREIPAPAESGDFETARRMFAPAQESRLESSPIGSLSWADFAELVFGVAGAPEVLACWKEAAEGLRFRIHEGQPAALSDVEVAREIERRVRKEGEAAERSAFILRARAARSSKRRPEADPSGPAQSDETGPFEVGDERFLAEIEALASGRSAKCRLCADLGIAEAPEAAQAFLLATGRWDESVNPHPGRAGCAISAPRVEIGVSDDSGRTDLTGIESWAIDNAWSKDPDDAVAWDGGAVWIHVADPAAAILPDSSADKEALARGSTLYLPELTSPMLPDEALDRFGLGLSETSPALSFRIEVAEDGSLLSVEAMASRVRVRRCSYGEADRLIDAGQAPDLASLERIAEIRTARRRAQGAVDINIPEVRVHIEDRGAGLEILVEPIPADRSSSTVRELMLLAGEGAARWAFERKLPFPFYSQEAPTEGPPKGGVLSGGAELSTQFARRRLMRAGISGPAPSAHRGLGLPFYAQATSPLRRYQDILGHMQLRAVLAGRPPLDADEVGRRCALAQAASAATRQAERDSVLHWTLAYLKRNPAWTGDGIIVGSAGPGAWQVYLPGLGLETRLRLGPDRRLDETIQLRLVRVDLAKLESSFDEVR